MSKEYGNSVESAVKKALDELVSYKVSDGIAYIQMPLVYDSGAVVVLEVRADAKGFLISDVGGAFEEADAIGASEVSFSRQAHVQADHDGVRYGNESFYIGDIPADQLSSAAIAVATSSQRTAHHVVRRHLEDAREDQAERLFAKISRTFDKSKIARKFAIRGVSNHEWKVDVAVLGGKTPVLFEAVSAGSKNSIYQAVAKFHDISRLEGAPRRISSVHDKKDLGDLLGVLAQTSSVIQDNTSIETVRKLAQV